MISTTERQEKLLDQHATLMNPSQTREMREAGLGIIESRREGFYVWDQSGTRYIDCRSETSVFNVGRRNPELIEKLKRALDEYDLGNALFFSEPRVLLAQKLGRLSPAGKLRGVTYGVGGGEINDFALKLARAQTRRRKVITMKSSYHGSTAFAASVSGYQRFRQPFMPLIPDVQYAKFGDIQSLRELIDVDTACVILEPIQTLAGIRISPKGYLEAVRDLCDQFGTLMIVDENETCLGRAGAMFAIEVLAPDVVPDIMTLGKALSGGLFPISAAIYRDELLQFWDENPFSHLSTFAGSDLGCIMGLETLAYVENHRLAEAALSLGEKFKKGFSKLLEKYPAVLRAFRGQGLAMAVDFTTDTLGPQMSRDLSQFGVLASYSQANPKTMLVTPPLILTEDGADKILEAFDRTLAGAQSLAVPRHYDSLESLMRSAAESLN